MNARANCRSRRRSSTRFIQCSTKRSRRTRRCRNCSGAIRKRSAAESAARYASAELRDDFRIKRAFRNLDPGVQRFSGIARQHRDFSLRDDLAAIDSRINIVNRTARNFFSGIERLLPRFDTGKFRQQRRMHIDDAAREGVEHWLFQHAHETGQDHEFHARIFATTSPIPFPRRARGACEIFRAEDRHLERRTPARCRGCRHRKHLR